MASDSRSGPPGKILILGGGTAGWMAAILMAQAWSRFNVDISLMESSDIGTIGVGEGSTPKMREFFDGLGIPESEWMPACNATYKCGIRFPGWSTLSGYSSYYHPFFTLADKEFVQSYYHNVTLRQQKNVDVHAHPDAFFVSNYLARSRRAPVAEAGSPYHTDYAYHFDAGKIGEFLKKKCLERGVKHLIDTVTDVERAGNGDIAALQTREHGRVEADFFVDCSGFAGLLIGKTLGVPFHPYKNLLFNDAAVALPTEHEAGKGMPSQTISRALKHGWAWQIPLTNRFGNGYVYASDFCSPEQAEQELREQTGQTDANVEARHLKMRVGCIDRCWERNCLAVGLSQGFIEPLEATALMVVQVTLEEFIRNLEQGGFSDSRREPFNRKIRQVFEGIRDYIYLHYKLNTRSDTEYWRANRENSNTPELVAELLDTWDRGGDLLAPLQAHSERLVYSHTSWVCILAGMGRFPKQPRKVKKKQQRADPKIVQGHCEKLLRYFPDHQSALRALSATPSTAD